MVDLARKILFYDRLRFVITVAGVGFAVTLVLVQTGLFLGLMDNATCAIDHMDADVWVAAKNTPNIDFARAFPDTYVNQVRAIDGVERADNLIVWFLRMALPSGAQEGMEVYAMERFPIWNLPWSISEGHPEDLARGHFCMLDDSAVRRCGPFHTGEYREFIGRRLKIIARSHDALSFTTAPMAFMDLRVAQSLTPELRGQTTYIVVKLAPGADRNRVISEIQRRLPYVDVHSREEWSSMSRMYWIKNVGLGMNLFMSVFLGCLIAVMVVAQNLYTSTMEHVKEFGTVKAIGGGNADIYRILAKQATLSALFGFWAGAILAMGLRSALLRAADLKLLVLPGVWGATFVGTVVLCLAAALISFRKVSRLDPAMVFRG
jgi:putative ABC transport system permease protein